ncbi:hypothetical protein ACIRJM_40955 [Streptomyces sp. NPDC102405]|uniref:hypothetical protein n=1 Tax=Streptomyces sp. NPDC102405 TaxID=3366170 RepID=UPI0038006620
MTARTMGDQASTLAFLAELALKHSQLPGAYITISRFTPGELSVQLDSPGKVEPWREALGVPVEEVFEDRIGNRLSLEFRASAYGVMFHVYSTCPQAHEGVPAQAA